MRGRPAATSTGSRTAQIAVIAGLAVDHPGKPREMI
jgi:hypothetical protein